MNLPPIVLSGPYASIIDPEPVGAVASNMKHPPLYTHSDIYLNDTDAWLLEAFLLTESKVLRLSRPYSDCMSLAMRHAADWESPRLYTVREDWPGPRMLDRDDCWVQFATHQEATRALSSNPPLAHLSPALDTDLEPHAKLQEISQLQTSQQQAGITMTEERSYRAAGLSDEVGTSSLLFLSSQLNYTLSSNPPNPKVTFRTGDWLCSIANCNAHNFGRNMACYGCGHPRLLHNPSSFGSPIAASNNAFSFSPSCIPRDLSSPSRMSFAPAPPAVRHHPLSRNTSPTHVQTPLKPPAPSYPLLTPSGHALAIGGRVKNISMDPAAPCVMYWPDNEPLPERGQIRPLGSAVMQYPPIVNTGNKGAAEKQPGDWCCSKCNYLNWRRRKVCQTCYPYAEGNGDSISQAVQAERIALLTNVLNQVDASLQPLQRRSSDSSFAAHNSSTASGEPQPKSRSEMDLRTQYLHQPPFGAVPGLGSRAGGFGYPLAPAPAPPAPPHLSRPHAHLGFHSQPHAIYQTPSPPSSSPSRSRVPSPTTTTTLSSPPPLLPSFLQDIIQESDASVHSSPATSSSSSWSFEEELVEYGEDKGSGVRYDANFDPLRDEELARGGRAAAAAAAVAVGVIGRPGGSIWKMSGEDGGSASVFAPAGFGGGRFGAGRSLVSAA